MYEGGKNMTVEQYYLLLAISFAITVIAQIMVKARYSKYKNIENKSGITGKEVARRILDENGMPNMKIIYSL